MEKPFVEGPPGYEPTHCTTCGRVIGLRAEGYSVEGGECDCEECTAAELPGLLRP